MVAMEDTNGPGPVDDAAVKAYYDLDKERDRLDVGVGRVEFLRTIEVVSRTLPAAPSTVADIGGGPGRYTDHLLAAGHAVVHRDLVDGHVEQLLARHPAGSDTGAALDTAVGDARLLDLADGSVDAVLLLGPIYHLVDEDDRRAALVEAKRVVRPGGPIYVAAISRRSVLLDGILMKRIDLVQPQVLDLLDGVATTGVLPPLFEGSFNGYLHEPEQFRWELIGAGLEVESLVNLEGVAANLTDLEQRLDDPEEMERLLLVLRAVESAPDVLGVGPHLLATARRPAG